jgi:hypothetical protein
MAGSPENIESVEAPQKSFALEAAEIRARAATAIRDLALPLMSELFESGDFPQINVLDDTAPSSRWPGIIKVPGIILKPGREEGAETVFAQPSGIFLAFHRRIVYGVSLPVLSTFREMGLAYWVGYEENLSRKLGILEQRLEARKLQSKAAEQTSVQ